MENQKTKIISIVALVALALTVVTATYAYFQAQTGEGSQTDIKINANTVDTFTFETGNAISINLDQTSFASGKGNITGNTYANAKLTANNKTNNATNSYNLYLNISDNNFGYTRNSSYPEILLTIKDASNNEITSISGLEYKTVTDGKGASISGFDITTKTGLITLLSNRKITTTSTKTDTWNITATFVNYNADQSKNAGKSFSGQVLISKDSFDDYTPNTINTLSATKSGTNLTVNLNVEQGSNEIDKYYYAIEEKSAIAYNTDSLVVSKLANTQSNSSLSFVESTSSSYTFTNLSSSKNYKVSAYLVDKKKLKSNTYEYNYYSDSYVYPVISKVETTATSSSITTTVTATKGTNNISKYYYSIDGGNTFVESKSNSYTFNSLTKNTSYKIIVKVMDSNNKYSNVFVTTSKTSDSVTLADYVKSQYTGTQGANDIYYHNSSLANGAGDNSYRYAGANPNNYVCFGSNASTCPEDSLYRIIGVFGNNVKLIKATSASSELLGTNGGYTTLSGLYYWSNLSSCPSDTSAYMKNSNTIGASTEPTISGCNIWKYSELNTINLNKNYLNYIGSTWSNMIESATWKVSGITSDDLTVKSIFDEEITSATKTYDPSNGVTKIGLMYASDYGYAINPSYWTTKMSEYYKVYNNNWLFMGAGWTLTPIGKKSVFILNNGVGVSTSANSTQSVYPSFYLNSDVQYVSGMGTYDNPFKIQ